MHDILKKSQNFIWKASLLLFVLLGIFVAGNGIFFWDGLDACYENKPVLLRGSQMILALITLGCIWLVLCRLIRRISVRSVRILSITLLVLIPVLQLFFVLHEPCLLRYDALKVYDEALSMLSDGSISGQVFGGYFARYTNNYGITIFAYLILKIASALHILAADYHNGLLILQIVNLVFTDLAFFLGWLMIRHSTGFFEPAGLKDLEISAPNKPPLNRTESEKQAAGDRAGLLYLLFVTCCPLSYVWLPFFYTNSISMVFAMSTIYFLYLIFVIGKRNPFLLFGCGFLIVFGFFIRATQVIVCIAMVLYLMLVCIKNNVTGHNDDETDPEKKDAAKRKSMRKGKRQQICMSCVVILLGMCIAAGGCRLLTNKYTTRDTDAQFPAIHWIAMGLNTASGGTFDTLDEIYTMQYATAAEKKEADMLLLKERLQDLGISGVCRLYFDKLRLTFSDGTGAYPTELGISDSYDGWYQIVYGNNRFCLQYYCQLTYLLALCFCIYGAWMILRKRELFGSPAFCIYITLLGAFLFHMIWEAGTIYSIGFTFLLYAGAGFCIACYMVLHKPSIVADTMQPKIVRTMQFPVIACTVCLLSICSLSWLTYDYSHFEEERRVALSVNQYLFLSDDYEPCESGMKLVQTFQADRDFNEIYLQTGNVGQENDSRYRISLCDRSGTVIDSCELDASSVAPYSLTLLSLHSKPENNSYSLVIEKIAGTDNLTFLYCDTGNYDAYKKGSLQGLKNSQKADLCFVVLQVL